MVGVYRSLLAASLMRRAAGPFAPSSDPVLRVLPGVRSPARPPVSLPTSCSRRAPAPPPNRPRNRSAVIVLTLCPAAPSRRQIMDDEQMCEVFCDYLSTLHPGRRNTPDGLRDAVLHFWPLFHVGVIPPPSLASDVAQQARTLPAERETALRGWTELRVSGGNAVASLG